MNSPQKRQKNYYSRPKKCDNGVVRQASVSRSKGCTFCHTVLRNNLGQVTHTPLNCFLFSACVCVCAFMGLAAWIKMNDDDDGWYQFNNVSDFYTCSSLMATQVLAGKSSIIGTRNCRHPFQWPISSIIEIRLNTLMNIPAILRNWHITHHRCNNHR